MPSIEFNLGAHILRSAKEQLEQHQAAGSNSRLSVFEAANLLDQLNTILQSDSSKGIVRLSLN